MPDLHNKSKQIDAFLSKTPKTFNQIINMVKETTEFPGQQRLIYNLMKLTNDVSSFSSDLVNFLSQDQDLAKQIIEKARLNNRLSNVKISVSQLKQSIQRLGYELVHNEIQNSLAKQYIKTYYNTENQELRKLIKKSVRLAYIAKDLAKFFLESSQTDAFFAGLNFYLGDLMLALRSQRSFNELNRIQLKGMDKKSAQMTVLGFETTELSSKKLTEWNLPHTVVDTVKNHADNNKVTSTNIELAFLLQFAEYINDSFTNKSSSPKAMWFKAQDFMSKLGKPMPQDKWVEEIKLMYIKLLEVEYSLYQR